MHPALLVHGLIISNDFLILTMAGECFFSLTCINSAIHSA